MAKLRLVKERRNSHDKFDQDLRGFGSSDVLANEYPWVFLAVTEKSPQVEEVCKLLGLELKNSKDQDHLFLYKKGKNETHKEKLLALLLAASFLSITGHKSPMLLAEMNILKHRLNVTSIKDISEEMSDDFNQWSHVEGLSVSDSARLLLQHADIFLSSNIVSKNELDSLVTHHSVSKHSALPLSKAS